MRKLEKNRKVLSKIIDCIKFCVEFELLLRGHDERGDSTNPGVFRGLLDLTSNLDSSFKSHFESATLFEGTSKTIQNEILESILENSKQQIKAEISKSNYLAVMCDETTDVFDKSQMVIVFRYEKNGEPVERFWVFFAQIS